jgi:hypothetical protein
MTKYLEEAVELLQINFSKRKVKINLIFINFKNFCKLSTNNKTFFTGILSIHTTVLIVIIAFKN